MYKTRTTPTGFTLVEIVVVVAVIAILATVGTFAYGGMQTRARNVQTAKAVEAYREALNTYFQINKRYPTQANTSANVCLGEKYTSSTCWIPSANVDAAFINELKSVYSSNLPSPSVVPNKFYSGIVFIRAIEGNTNYLIDGVQSTLLVYAIEGTGPCPVGPVLAGAPNGGADDGNVFTYFSTPPTTGQSIVADLSGSPARCVIGLPREF